MALIFFCGLGLTACGTLPPLPERPDFAHHPAIKDTADKLQTYYNWRLTPNLEGDGYHYGKLEIPKWRLGAFLDHQGDTAAASWARKGNAFIGTGWTLALGLESAAIAIGAQAADGDPARNAWWVALGPSMLLGWTFHWIGDNWFRRPAAAHYDLQLKRELDLTQD
jgi:hypothetical protein